MNQSCVTKWFAGNHTIRYTDVIANHFSYTITANSTNSFFDHYLIKNAASLLKFDPVSKEYISKIKKLIKIAREVLVEPLTLLVTKC